jgi:thiol-disulfide isomerase/thioredoxin
LRCARAEGQGNALPLPAANCAIRLPTVKCAEQATRNLGPLLFGVLANLPNSGRWLSVVERAFAVIMILLAEYFLIYLGHSIGFPKLPTPFAYHKSLAPQILRIGQAAPDWALKELNGDSLSLSQFKVLQGVIMGFFATWCPACMDEVAQLKQLQYSYDKRAVVLPGVNAAQPADALRAFVSEKRINYKVLLDENGAVSANYGVEVLVYRW